MSATLRHLLLGSLLLTLAAGCARRGVETSVLSWPAAPAEPLVVYERSIYGSQSLQRSFFGKFKDFLFGPSPEHELSKPYGLAYDGKGRLYVADSGQKSVLILDFDAGQVHSFGSLGRHGRLIEPINVTLDAQGSVYVADTRLGRIAKFDGDGHFLRFLGEEGDLESPVGLAVDDERGALYVVDTRQHDVKIFDLESGALLRTFGSRGDEKGEFFHPLGIEIADDGTIYVVDAFHFAVQAFTPDGEYAFSFGPRANGIGSMARPRAIAIDADRHLYVTDALRHNFQIYEADGSRLMDIGVSGLAAGQFRLPAGICITEDGRIFVADSINRRIQQFRYVRGSAG